MRKRLAIILLSIGSFTSLNATDLLPHRIFVPNANNQQFRNEVMNYIRGVAIRQINPVPLQQLESLDAQWNNFYQKTDWSVQIVLYHQGKSVGEGYANGPHLAKTLTEATLKSLKNQPASQWTKKELTNYRFKVVFDYYPAHLYSSIEYLDQALELVGSRVALRRLDTELINQQIIHSRDYLLRNMHPKFKGFFKFYDAKLDQKESLLRTIYSSSSLYTLLKLYALSKNPSLEQYFKPIAHFILSNQEQNGPNAGGFYYGFDPKNNKTIKTIKVGTTSKTIFTLLELNQFYPNDPQYYKAAMKAGDWLLTMVQSNGKVTSSADWAHGQWTYSQKQSFLYSGQVLSALSRLYAATHDSRYREGALKIAQNFLNEVSSQGPLVGDDFRPANSISTSWVLMSLIDFAKIDTDPKYLTAIEQVASTILARQIKNKEDVYSNGRYLDAMTTSGNGWINEVMGVLYGFCQSKSLPNCMPYREAMILSSRWLLQNAYTKQNTYNVKNPSNAIGGFITNFTTQTVRTDAVCHGVNSLIALLTIIGPKNQVLLTLPEQPLAEILPLLRAGNGFL